jgi:beta-lactamase class D
MKPPTLAIVSILVLLFSQAGGPQAALRSCLVVAEGDRAAERWAGSATECATRLSPASTYKIPHALIGLETGVVTRSSRNGIRTIRC